MLERWRPGKSSNPGAAKADGQAWWKLPRRVLGVWSLANGRLECPNKRRLCRQRAGCNAGTLTARKEQQPWSSKGWRPGLVEAAAEGFRDLGIWSLANGRLECPNKRRLCRQRAGCNAGTLTARKEQQPWSSKGWRPGLVEAAAEGFRVLGIWSLANGRLECPNKRRLCRQRAGCNAGTLTARKEQQPWSSKGWLGGSCQAWWKLTREGCAGKGQAAMLERWRPGIRAATLEQQRLTARLGGSCRGGF